jgi:hypothetical protein
MIGVATVLHRLGHPAAALRVAQICLAERWERLGTDLHGGLSGMALALLELGEATGEARLLEAGLRAADMVAAGPPSRAAAGHGGPVGLLRGSSGPGLLFVRMFERTRDHRYLDLAAAAIGADLDRCVLDGQGALKVDEGWRLMPYLDGGSVGVGLAIDDFLAHRGDDRFEQAVKGIRAAACSTYFAQPSLFRGRAGMLMYLARGRAGDAAGDPQVAAHVRRLAWHAISYRGGTAFPGETLFRLSMDLATGTAGVLLGLASALSPDGARLPCHRPAQRPGVRAARVSGHPDVPGSSGQGLQEVSVITRR